VGVLQGLERIQSGLCEKIDFLRGYGGKSKMNKVFDNICRAFKNHDIDGAKKLIAHSNVNDPIGVYGSILILTISCDSICTLDFIDHLIDIGVDINAVDSDNETALYTAIRYYRYDVILRLLKCGARFGTISTRTYGSEIDEAIDESSRTRDAEMVWLLYSYGARPLEKNVNQMNELIGSYIRCSSVAYTLIGIRKFRRSVLSQHPKEIILMIGGCITRTRKDPKWTM
jgi:hypothetical protein